MTPAGHGGDAADEPSEADEVAIACPVDRSLREEFPGLALRLRYVDRGSGKSSAGLKQRLKILSDRLAGAQAIAMRNRPIPWAYRVFYRHIGLDPDEQPTAIEELVRERLLHGGFPSRNALDDALTIAVVESGVTIRAFDAGGMTGLPSIRPTLPGEELEGRPGDLPAGTLVIADERRPLALLFGALASGRGVDRKTTRIALVAIAVPGVPAIAVEEALWLAAQALEGA